MVRPLDSAVTGARRLKHLGLLGKKWAQGRLDSAIDLAHHAGSCARPYYYRPEAHRDSFLSEIPRREHDVDALTSLPRQAFLLWTGTNEMSANRAAAVAELRDRNPGLEVHLVDPTTLSSWVVADHPLHRAYDDLSLVHRSDYLRAYLLHHHGGVYCDVKRGYGDLRGCLDSLATRPEAWVSGYRELSATLVAQVPGSVGRALRRHHRRLVGNGAYVARRGTPLTSEWLAEVERRLDQHATALRAAPGDSRGTNPGYPVRWTELLGEVFQPLQLKYLDHVVIDERLTPSLVDFT